MVATILVRRMRREYADPRSRWHPLRSTRWDNRGLRIERPPMSSPPGRRRRCPRVSPFAACRRPGPGPGRLTGVVTTRDDGLPPARGDGVHRSLNVSATTDAEGRYTLDGARRPPPGRPCEVKAGVRGARTRASAPSGSRARLDPRLRARPRLPRGDHRRVARGGRGGGEGGAGGHHHRAADRGHRAQRDDAGHPEAGPLLQLPAAHDHRRHGLRAPGHPARPGPGPGARPHQRQAAAHQRARARERHRRAAARRAWT